VRTEVESYDISEGNQRLPSIAKVPYLDIAAALNDSGDKLTLFCVNRHLQKDLTARIDVTGFRGANAEITTLNAPSIYVGNSEMRPEAVVPVPSATAVPANNWTYAFPRSSVTVIEVSR
jgi:alpha-N-arabinofuranosidase